MAIKTALTERFGLEYPIVLAPMGNVSGGRLAAAVSNAGGLGLVGGAYGDPDWMRQELLVAKTEATRPWGVGLITWHATNETVEFALQYEPDVFMLSFGDPQPYAPTIKAAGCALLCQVQDVEDARAATAAGADVIIAQGTEAGGHGARRATLPLVPAVVDAVAPTPVLAAGGIVDGRGLAAALMLGAQGVLMGTRFYAATESLGHQGAKERYTGRALRNTFLERWDGHEDDLEAALDTEIPAFVEAAEEGNFDTAMVWAGEGVDLISDIAPAAELVRRIGAEAEACLQHTGEFLSDVRWSNDP